MTAMTGLPIPHFDLDDEASADTEVLPPACTFTLAGREWTVRNKDLIPFNAMYQVTAATEVGLPLAIGPFFAGALEPGQVKDFMEVLSGPKVTLPMATRAVQQIVAALYGRPTMPSAKSPGSRKRAGVKSAGGSSSQVTAKRRSAS